MRRSKNSGRKDFFISCCVIVLGITFILYNIFLIDRDPKEIVYPIEHLNFTIDNLFCVCSSQGIFVICDSNKTKLEADSFAKENIFKEEYCGRSILYEKE